MRLDQKIAFLRDVPFLAEMDADAMHVLAFSAEEKSHRPGEQLFAKDALSDGGYLLIEGRVALDASGEGVRGAETFGAGVLIGEAALLAQTRRPATAIVVEPSRSLFVSRETMQRVLEAHPGSASRLRAFVLRHLSETGQNLNALLRG